MPQQIKKYCPSCKQTKFLSDFHKNTSKPCGVNFECKNCVSARSRKEREINKFGVKKTVLEKYCYNCKSIKSVDKFNKNSNKIDGLADECKECSERYAKQYRSKKKQYFKKYNEQYKNKNKDELNRKLREKRKNDILYKLKHRLRARINTCIKRLQIGKIGHAIKDLGCSIEYFKNYLESLFKIGMNWGNYGEWHIDHIIPLNSFDLTNEAEFKKACHYTNLQPLWAIDNIKKGHKVP